MDKCKYCPLKNVDTPCIAQKHRRYCEKMDPENPIFTTSVRRIILEKSGESPNLKVGILTDKPNKYTKYLLGLNSHDINIEYVKDSIDKYNVILIYKYDHIKVDLDNKLQRFVVILDEKQKEINIFDGAVATSPSVLDLFPAHQKHRISLIDYPIVVSYDSVDKRHIREHFGFLINKVYIGCFTPIELNSEITKIIDCAREIPAIVVLVGEGGAKEAIETYAELNGVKVHIFNELEFGVENVGAFDYLITYENSLNEAAIAAHIALVPVISKPTPFYEANHIAMLYDGTNHLIDIIRNDVDLSQYLINAHYQIKNDFTEDLFLRRWKVYIESVWENPKNSVHNIIGFFEKIRNVSMAGRRYISAGAPSLVPENVRQERLNKCMGCKFIDDNQECSLCGCPVQRKTLFPTESCPHDPPLWDVYKIEARGGCGCGGG
jgi:hypothetical protein